MLMLPVEVELPVVGSNSVAPACRTTFCWSTPKTSAPPEIKALAVVEHRVGVPRLGAGRGLSVLAPSAAGRVVQLGGAAGNPGVADVADLQHLAVGKQPRQRPVARETHAAGVGPGSGGGVVQLGAASGAAASVAAGRTSGHEHLPVLQQRRGRSGAGDVHAAGRAEGARYRVVKLRAAEVTAAVVGRPPRA